MPTPTPTPKTRNVALYTFGCKLNFAETATYARQFAAHGWQVVEQLQQAQVVVINSCAVTEHAQRKCRQLLQRAQHLVPEAPRVVVGCYADLQGDLLLARGLASLVVKRTQKNNLFGLLMAHLRLSTPTTLPPESPEGQETTGEHFFPAFSSSLRTRAFLKIQDGCNYGCSYCTIPQARGASRSATIAQVVAQAQRIVAAGRQEIVLTGVNTGEFGRSHGQSLQQLLQALDQIHALARTRISSIEPNLLNDNLLAYCQQSRTFMPHLHVPLQSGSPRILRLMRRRYTPDTYRARVAAARQFLPDPFIGVDVIVGFPGETEEDFQATYKLLEELAPAFLHIFPYSPRPGTPAATMPGRPASERVKARAQRLENLCQQLHRNYCLRAAHTTHPVLVEQCSPLGRAEGYTDNYIRVDFPAPTAQAGDIAYVTLSTDYRQGIMAGKQEGSQI